MYTGDRSDALQKMREKHGFKITPQQRKSARKWSKEFLSNNRSDITSSNGNGSSDLVENAPRNAQLYDFLVDKFIIFGFSWAVVTKTNRKGQLKQIVEFKNYPTLHGRSVTLADLFLIEPELLDGYEDAQDSKGMVAKVGQSIGSDAEKIIQIITDSGIGYKGLSGPTWLPGITPFQLPLSMQEKLILLGRALIVFFDTVQNLYKEGDADLVGLLTAKLPNRIKPLMLDGSVDIIRPDIVIATNPETGELIPVVTEFESCPAGQGMAYAMEAGYGLDPTMLDAYVEYLNGRDYLVLATNEWSDYVFEQGTFIRALRNRGVDARLVFDAQLDRIHAEVQKNWKPPAGMPDYLRGQWNTDFLGRLRSTGFHEFVYGFEPDELVKTTWVGSNTVVSRFGYFDNFSAETLELMSEWQSKGAKIVNPLQFCLESKSLMAAIHVDSVREFIQATEPWALEVLDTCVAETRLLDSRYSNFAEFRRDQPFWLTKFAAWDGNNQSWGSRSLTLGTDFGSGPIGSEKWRTHLHMMSIKDFPVVAQHIIASKRYNAAYISDGRVEMMTDARTRLTPFFLRKGDSGVTLAGSTITLRTNTFRIHGATDAFEAPVIYRD